MDCRTARRLIDQGIAPGPRNAQRAALGFHLADCAACRAYRANPNDTLLRELLAAPPPRRSRRRPAPARRQLVPALVVVLLIVGTLLLSPTALALVTIQQNYHAMQRATIARPTALLTPAQPHQAATAQLATVAPSATAQPLAPQQASSTSTPQLLLTPPPSRTAGAEPTVPSFLPPTQVQLPPEYLTPIALPPEVALGANGRRINSVPTLMPTVVIPPSGGAITVLLLGIDQRPDETYPARADAIAVARIDPERQRVALLSLPRDLIVNIPGFGYQRINAASVLGELNPQYTGGGVALTRATVSDFLGIPIDHVVHANFQGFIGAIDAIGGVHITVERELYDAQYPTMDYGYTVAHFLPGPQHMDGATALIYGRMRHMDSDFERIKRQQQVMVAALARVREQNPLAQIESVAALSTALRDYVTTDLPQERLLGLAWALRNLEPAQVERYAVDASMVSEYAVPGDPYAQIPIPGAIQSLAQRLVTGP